MVASYVWLCDRYLSPDLTTWTTQSLHKEYRYIHNGDTDSFSENALEPINIDNNELNSEIAERAVYQQKTRTLNIQYGKLIDAAEQNLRKQDYRGAYAGFTRHAYPSTTYAAATICCRTSNQRFASLTNTVCTRMAPEQIASPPSPH